MSQDAGWPHRAEDWALTLSVSQGVVALQDDKVVATALCSCFGEVATINMIIVSADMRGQGLGRKVMQAVLKIAGARELRLTATTDGLPLYEKLGFETVGDIVQYQGLASALKPAAATAPSTDVTVQSGCDADLAEIAAMDLAASGLTVSGGHIP